MIFMEQIRKKPKEEPKKEETKYPRWENEVPQFKIIRKGNSK